VIGTHRGSVAVVVVGVTTHQGARESLAQGEGPQVKAFQALKVRRWETSWETFRATWNIEVVRVMTETVLHWRAGCSEELPVRF
jgi:hypothetical protein